MRRSQSYHNLHGRGQILSSEFMIAAIIFMFVLGAILFLWTSTALKINQSETIYSMDESATAAAEKLVRTGGLPMNWSKLPADNISAIGLVNESRVIDSEKLSRFIVLMDDSTGLDAKDNPCLSEGVSKYMCNRHFLGLGRYDFYVNISYINGTSIGDTGVEPGPDVDYIISKRRNALLNGSVVAIKLSVWY